MPPTVDAIPPALDPRVQSQLRRLGALLLLRLALRGLAWTIVALLAAGAVSFAVDYGLYRLTAHHLPLAARSALNALCLGAAGFVAWKRLFGPCLRSYADADLAALVERGHPQLEDRLLSSVHFARAGGSGPGASPQLIRQVTVQATLAAAGLRFDAVLHAGPMWRALAVAGAALLMGGLVALASPSVFGRWLGRNVLLREEAYPRRTVLRIEGGNPIRVLRGEPLSVRVNAREGRVAPASVTFHMRFASGSQAAEDVAPLADDRLVYVKTFAMVNEPLALRVSGNDDRTDEVRIEVVDPPELRELELEVRSPPYTLLAPRKARRGIGALEVPEDGVIALVASASKDIDRATVHLDQDQVASCRIDGRRIETEFAVKAPRPYRPSMHMRIALRDVGGFENAKAASLNLTLRQDQAPTVRMEAGRIGGEITPVAILPLIVAPRDDYGIAALKLQWSVQSAPQRTQEEILNTWRTPVSEPGQLPYAMDLRQLAARDQKGAPPLQVGETLRLQAVALDSRPPASGGAQTGVSNLVTFRIVTPDELMAKAIETQRALREQISQTVEMQKDVRDRLLAAQSNAASATTLALALRDVGTAHDTEQQIEDLLGGTAERLQVLLEQLRNNRAVSGEDEVRLRTGVIEPLQQARQHAISPLVAKLEAVRAMSDAQALSAELARLISAADAAIRALEAIVSEMLKVESAQHVEGGIRALIKLGDEVRQTMKKQGVGETPATKPSTQPEANP
jgi:predicted phage tail protein